jgi:ATP-dependent helicase/nuclease subunit B
VTLNAQSTCPVRAFCEHRLGAKAVEAFSRGIPARIQGIAAHAALERFFGVYCSRRGLAEAPVSERRDEAGRCAEAALTRAFGSARESLLTLFVLEAERLTAAIEQLAGKELERADFRVVAVEQRQSLKLSGKTLTMRIDRVDTLDDGTLAIIDYKTGRGSQPSTWLSPRPRDVQLPAYALALPGVSALVVTSVRSSGARYAGVWQPGAFPGRSRQSGDEAIVAALLERWRQSIGALIDEYSAGDTRLFVSDPEPAAGAFAPLTRVYEQLAFHRESTAGVRS